MNRKIIKRGLSNQTLGTDKKITNRHDTGQRTFLINIVLRRIIVQKGNLALGTHHYQLEHR